MALTIHATLGFAIWLLVFNNHTAGRINSKDFELSIDVTICS